MADENGDATFLPIQEGTVDAALLTSQAELGEEPSKELSGNHEMENGVSCDIDKNHDQIFQLFLELSLQNAYLVAQLNEFKTQVDGSFKSPNQEKEDSQQLMLFQQKIEILTKEILELKETQKPAEDALQYLRIEYSEANAKVHDLSIKLVEAQQKMEKEIKERDEKYAELDSKFGRLHKRAKQRIQEIQKEKDDLEAHFRNATEKVEQASNQQSSMQQELEHARLQASEALRSMDMERQQLRTTNYKLRDDIDEMHRAVETKQNALEELRQTLLEKEQMLEESRRLLQAAEDRKQTSMVELSTRNQKIVEDLEDQIAEAISDRSKAAEAALSLQALIGEKDAKIAELEAASTGEAVRLGAAVEATKAEIARLKNEHGKEKETWETALQTIKVKLEASESARLHSEIEAAKMRSELELKLSLLTQLLNTKDSELKAYKEEIARVESDFSSYKVRAHALLQKKDAELQEAKENDVIKAQENTIREAEREVALSQAERDKAFHDLQNALENHDKEIAARNAVLSDAVQQARSIALELDSAKAQYQSEKESSQKSLADLENNWRMKYRALEVQNNEKSRIDLNSKIEDLKLENMQLKDEHETFRDIVDRMLEEKDKEISKLLKDNNTLRQSLESNSDNYNGNLKAEFVKQDAPNFDVAVAEQQILLLARQQAQREEELAQSQRHILALQDEIEELERENRLHSQQEALLKEEVRNMERKHKREGVDMTYLKNVILKLLETGEVEALLPVVGTLLQFSPNEIQKCQKTYRSTTDKSLSSTTSPPDPAASTPLSLLSRFSLS